MNIEKTEFIAWMELEGRPLYLEGMTSKKANASMPRFSSMPIKFICRSLSKIMENWYTYPRSKPVDACIR